ncbi:MAG: phospho-N-acetylmuramoyl-pentapeptide-transferase [Bacteroidetes bacterium]|nr:MAG: phospho-N-acetylmuramoyl-pentapeptide-transferase [Bacteroidota bacterium]
MLYYLLDWLDTMYNVPGFGVFKYITFRAILSIIFSLIISLLIGRRIIDMLRRRLIGEVVRDAKEGPDHGHKKGTPTMGGIILLSAVVVPTLLWGDLENGYVWLILVGTVWMGLIGFIDDYIKVFKKDKRGLKGKFKLAGQILLGLMVGLVMLFHPDFRGSRAHLTQLNIVKADRILQQVGFRTGDELIKVNGETFTEISGSLSYDDLALYRVKRTEKDSSQQEITSEVEILVPQEQRKTVGGELFGPRDRSFIYTTDFPFFKKYVFDYSKVWFLEGVVDEFVLGRVIYLLMVIFIVTAVSNAVNLTDGIDGLAAGTSAIVAAALGLFAYVSGNYIFSNYLHISYIPLSSELLIFVAALVGGCLGFLWWNSYPAQVFMGDTGSLALGGAIGILALMVKKELLIPILCAVFFAESLSVILQVLYFKFQKARKGVEYAREHRLFRMSPLHHHYEKGGMHESKITIRFFIVAMLMAAVAFATLKLR